MNTAIDAKAKQIFASCWNLKIISLDLLVAISLVNIQIFITKSSPLNVTLQYTRSSCKCCIPRIYLYYFVLDVYFWWSIEGIFYLKFRFPSYKHTFITFENNVILIITEYSICFLQYSFLTGMRCVCVFVATHSSRIRQALQMQIWKEGFKKTHQKYYEIVSIWTTKLTDKKVAKIAIWILIGCFPFTHFCWLQMWKDTAKNKCQRRSPYFFEKPAKSLGPISVSESRRPAVTKCFLSAKREIYLI